MSTNFDLEQQIFDCWKIVDELDLVYEELCDENITLDRTTNVLLGMKELYQIKFDRLFGTFEQLCDEIRQEKENGFPPLPQSGPTQFSDPIRFEEQNGPVAPQDSLMPSKGLNGPAGGPSTFDIIRKLQVEQDQKIKDLLNQERMRQTEEDINKVMFKKKL
jgi:hypothetical protein